MKRLSGFHRAFRVHIALAFALRPRSTFAHRSAFTFVHQFAFSVQTSFTLRLLSVRAFVQCVFTFAHRSDWGL